MSTGIPWGWIAASIVIGCLILWGTWFIIRKRWPRVTPPIPPSAGAPAPAPTASRGWGKLIAEYFWVIILGLVGAAILIWGLIAPVWNPQPADVGSWGWGRLIPLLAFCAVVYAIIAIIATGATQKALYTVLAGAVLLVLVASPIIGWFTSPSEKGVTSTKVIPPEEVRTRFDVPGGETRRVALPPGMGGIVVQGDEHRAEIVRNNGTVTGYDITNQGKFTHTYVVKFIN